MTTILQRLELLLPVLAGFPALGAFADRSSLLELLVAELGGLEALEDRASRAPASIVHILSENTPLAAMQSLLRGLLLGSRNRCKLPASGLPDFEAMVSLLPPDLRELVECSTSLPEDWLVEAAAVVVFGRDETVATLRKRVRPDQVFAGYGHRWSGVVIFSDTDGSSLPLVARDVGLYDQLGCLSAQLVFVEEDVPSAHYARRLAAAMQEYEAENPRGKLAAAEHSAIERWRQHYHWRAAMQDGTEVWTSPGSTAWTVVHGPSARLALTPLYRCVLVVPFSGKPQIGPLSASLSSLALWPFTAESRANCAGLGASRLCAAGDLQFPHPTWQQDGFPALGRLLVGGR